MPTVFLNGRFCAADGAMVSAFDAGFQHGVGLFETILASVSGGEARVPFLGDHLDRLVESARALGLSETLRRDPLGDAVVETAERAAREMNAGNGNGGGGGGGETRLRVRLTITGGDLNMLGRARSTGDGGESGGGGAHNPTLLIHAQRATEYPEAMFERGVLVTLAEMRVNPFNPLEGHKTLSYWARLRELQAAAAKRAGEALVFTITNHLAGGCVSNAMIVKDGVIHTPIARGEEEQEATRTGGNGVPIPSPVLPGVTRKVVTRLAGEVGLEVRRRMITIHEILSADEVFLTNSSWGVLPVTRVESQAIGSGEVGGVTGQIRRMWLREWGGR
ncbi:MAG: aminotransferase class IV family protein [Phycisphaerales bacterium]|nr:aminotransferase class IV family protein [Phycisphaerales bacterium]